MHHDHETLTRFGGANTKTAPSLILPLDEGDGADCTFIISTASTDSYGDVIEPKGISTEVYAKNPVVLWNHSSDVPIGKTTSIGVKGGELRARVRFADASTPAFGPIAAGVRELVRQGILSGASIGFTPIASEPIRDKQGRDTGRRYTRVMLREWSVCAIPANAEAVALARSIGLTEHVIRTLMHPTAPAIGARARREREHAARQRALDLVGSGSAPATRRILAEAETARRQRALNRIQ